MLLIQGKSKGQEGFMVEQKVVKLKKEKKCLKFTGYIYLPDEDTTYKWLRYHSARLGVGRLRIFDENNSKTVSERDLAFQNISEMAALVAEEYKKRVLRLLKSPGQVKKSGKPIRIS